MRLFFISCLFFSFGFDFDCGLHSSITERNMTIKAAWNDPCFQTTFRSYDYGWWLYFPTVKNSILNNKKKEIDIIEMDRSFLVQGSRVQASRFQASRVQVSNHSDSKRPESKRRDHASRIQLLRYATRLEVYIDSNVSQQKKHFVFTGNIFDHTFNIEIYYFTEA